MEYKVIRSKRKTLVAEIGDGRVTVRAPYVLSDEAIKAFLEKNREKIEKALKNRRERPQYPDKESDEGIMLLKKAQDIISERVKYYSEIMGLTPKKMKITYAKKRFGSCSSKGNICFSCYLALYPREAVDYVVVHELAHLRHLDHSKDFWAVVERYMPDYKRRRDMLK